MQEPTTGTWGEYQRLVLGELERLNEGMEKRDAAIQDMKTQIAILQVKSGVWGMIGGAITVAITLAVYLVTK